jgi:hypothetical protein
MKRRRFSLPMSLVLCLSLVSVSVLTKTGTAQAATDAPAPMQNAPFKGKIVVVSFIDGSTRFTTAMEQVRVQKIGDRYFLIGKGIDYGAPHNWAKGHTVWVPMNSVTRMCEMDSVEETRAAYREANDGESATSPPQQPKKAVFAQQKNSPPAEVLMKPFFFGQTDK